MGHHVQDGAAVSAPRKIGCLGVVALFIFIIAALSALGSLPGGPLE